MNYINKIFGISSNSIAIDPSNNGRLKDLPNEIIDQIFSFLLMDDLKNCRTLNHSLSLVATDRLERKNFQVSNVNLIALGKEKNQLLAELEKTHLISSYLWNKHFSNTESIVVTPKLIQALLASCPFEAEKKVHQTHAVCLIPEKILEGGEQIYTVDTASEVLSHPKEGDPVVVQRKTASLNTVKNFCPAGASHWVLLYKGAFFDKLPERVKELGYDIPTTLEALTVLGQHRVRHQTHALKLTALKCLEVYRLKVIGTNIEFDTNESVHVEDNQDLILIRGGNGGKIAAVKRLLVAE